MPDPIPAAAVVDRWWTAKQRHAETKAELEAAEKEVLALGRGNYVGTLPGAEVTVVAASAGGTTYQLASEDEDAARKIAGDSFGKLFERTVSYKPCRAFADVVPKLLPKGPATKLLSLCAKETSPKKAHLRA